MHKIIYTIKTPSGNCYELSKDGYVLKYSNGLDKTNSPIAEAKTWQVLGIVELKAFGNIGPIIPLEQASQLKYFLFKNGNPKYTLVDVDHGTERIVGNTKYHGVRYVVRK